MARGSPIWEASRSVAVNNVVGIDRELRGSFPEPKGQQVTHAPQGQQRLVEVEHDCRVSDEDENAAVVASRFASPSLLSSSSFSGVQKWREALKEMDEQSAAKLAELIATAQAAEALGVRRMPPRGRWTEEALQAARERRKDPVCLQLPMPAPEVHAYSGPVARRWRGGGGGVAGLPGSGGVWREGY